MPKTGDTRTTAKNKFGLQGQSPIDPQLGEVLPRALPGLVIAAEGGTEVRATHPGRVRSVTKTGSTFFVEVAATQGPLTKEALSDIPFTSYGNLGTVDVTRGDSITPGQQIGTVAFRRVQTSLFYQTFLKGVRSSANEVAPDSRLGRLMVSQANPDGIPPAPETQLREPPPEGDAALNRDPADTATVDGLPTTGERISNGDLARYAPQVRFAEQKNQVFNHDFLVFIDGVDITKFVTGELVVNLADKDGWNEANFELNNSHDNFVVTLNNLGMNESGIPTFRSTDVSGENKYSEVAKERILIYKDDEERNPFVDIERMKIAGTTSGVQNVNVTGREQEQADVAVRNQAETSRQIAQRESLTRAVDVPTVGRRWHIGHQSTVFHKNDPVRIFRKNPLKEVDEWMPAFTGYLNQISYNTNYVNGTSVVKLSCYDIRALAQKMRVQTTAVTGVTNPRAIFLSAEGDERSLFTDLINPAILGHPLSGTRYEDVMEFLITGTSEQDPAVKERFAASKFRRGIGDFTVGDRIYYKPGKRKDGVLPDPLEQWHGLCLFGMDGQRRIGKDRRTVLGGSAGKTVLGAPFNRRWLTEAEARKIGRETTHDGEWAPHKQFLHFLLPVEGTGARNLLDFDAVNATSNQLDFRSRLDIMQDFSNRIDYQFWVTPIGDIVIEFPMYDFRPEDYQEFRSILQVDKHLRSDNIQDEAGEMITAIVAHGGITPLRNVGEPAEQFQPKAIVVAPLMMMRYGVIEHELTLPFISDANSLRRIASIEFQKKLAESNKMDMDFDYRPFLLPNRPIENVERKRMGLTTAVRNSLSIFRDASTAVTTRYVRRQILNQDRRSVSYTLITGGESMPITYREIYEPGTAGIGANIAAGTEANTVRLRIDGIDEGISTEGQATSNSANPEGTDPTIPLQVVGTANTTRTTGVATNSPTPSIEQVSRFVALAQQQSGFNPLNRNSDGGYGIFGLRPEVRASANGGLGIGDSTDVGTQISAADQYFRGLVGKWAGDLDMAVSEFVLGANKIRNAGILEEFKKGFLAVNKQLGKEFEKIAQPLTEGFKKLFPGETNPVDTQLTSQSEDAAKAGEAAAETPEDSAKGSQSTVGILVFDNRGELATKTNSQSLQQTQAVQNNG